MAGTALSLLAVGLANEPASGQDPFPVLRGSYLGQPLPGTKPVLFAPGIISTDLHDDFSPAFAPDGREVFFRCVSADRMLILHMVQESGQWGRPRVAPFSGRHGDLGAFLGSDGARLFFSSDRPVDSADVSGDLDLFTVDRTDSGWGEPQAFPLAKGGAGDVLGCSIGPDGTIYCHARIPGGSGGYDIGRLRLVNGACARLEPLPAPINTPGDETCPCIARDGSYLIYSAGADHPSGRAAGLYVTFRGPDQSWTRPDNLTQRLGMKLPGKYAGLSPDGRYLFFVVPEPADANRRLGRRWDIEAFRGAEPRPGGGNVYWVDAAVVAAMRPQR